MTNVEIYDTSNSELSSDEYSHEEDDDALMEAAVSKQASPGNSTLKAGAEAEAEAGASSGAGAKPKTKPSENADDGSPPAPDAAKKDNITEAAAAVVQEPPSTTAEAIRRIRQLQEAPYRQPFVFFKRRSLYWMKDIDQRDKNYRYFIKRKDATESRKRYTSYSRSVSYSRSNSRSLSRSRSRSRSFDRSLSSGPSPGRSVSQSPELICLDDTENEDSPEKPEDAKTANVTPIKDNKAKIIKPPQFEQKENDKSNENGTSSVLEEFLIISEPKQPSSQAGIELDKLTASLELEEAVPDTTLVQQEDQVEEEPMAMDVTLKRRRSVTPPTSNEKRRLVDDDEDPIIEFTPVEATPVLKMQPSELTPRAAVIAPTANPLQGQSQPAFKLSSPYTLTPSLGANAKQTINMAALSQSLNTPTPPTMAMEISYPTDNLPHITKSNIVIALPEQTPPVAVPAYGSASYASALQWSSPAQAAHAQVGPQRDVSAQNDPPRAAIPLQSATPAAIQAPFATQRVLPAQVATPRPLQPPTRVPLQVNSPRIPGVVQADHLPRPTVPQQAATPLRPAPPQQQQQPPVQMQQEQPQVPVNVSSFAVPQQPQPRRSETVSTQTATAQSESRPKPPSPDLKNKNATFHYRLKELFPDMDEIFREKLDTVGPDYQSCIADIDADVKTLDELLAKKEDEWNRLFHLRCMKIELRGRLERKERMSIIKKLLPTVVKQNCSNAELHDLQESMFGESLLDLPFRSGPGSLEQCLNNVEVNQSNIERLRKVMGLKEKVPTASHYHFEEKQQQNHYRRSSLPVHQALLREFRDAQEELYHQERSCDLPPVNKRPRLLREQDRYAHEMTNSAPNSAASSPYNKLRVPGRQQYYSQSSAGENFLENESQIKPLYNSSPMASQRNLARDKRLYDEIHSTSYRNEEVEAERPSSRVSNTAKGPKKSQSQSRSDFTTTNGKEKITCQHCNVFEAIFECTRCQNQWYCSSKCQLDAWETHWEHCGQ